MLASPPFRAIRVLAGVVGLALILWVWQFGGPEVAFWISLGLQGVMIVVFMPSDLQRQKKRQSRIRR